MARDGIAIESAREPYCALPWDVIDHENTTKHDLLVYAALARYENADRLCWPSLTTICKRARLARSTVCEALDHLEKLGFVLRQKTERLDGSPDNTRYIIGARADVAHYNGSLHGELRSSQSGLGVVRTADGGSSPGELEPVSSNQYQYNHTSRGITPPQVDTSKRPTKRRKPKSPADELARGIMEYYAKDYPDGEFPVSSLPSQWQGADRIAAEARRRQSADPAAWVSRFCAAYDRLRETGDKFWRRQPRVPSRAASAGIMPQIIEAMDHEASVGNLEEIEEALRDRSAVR